MSGSDDMRMRITHDLLRIGAVVFSPDEPFTWASGIESPVYVDNRLTMSYPQVRKVITEGFVSIMTSEAIDVDAVVGTATAGIPHAAWLAGRLDLPLAYVRGSAKQHGRRNKIEGRIGDGDRVVVVEDLVSTGGSSLDAVNSVRDSGARVLAVLAVFTYGMQTAADVFRRADVPLHCLTDFASVLDTAIAEGRVKADDEQAIREWHADLVSSRPERE
jgi:orotate phosphoribosyltransferase